MPVLSRLIRVGTIAQSMSVYLPAMVAQKTLGMVRLILFTYLLSRQQMGIWSSGVMLFILGAPILGLGANHAMARYVSVYEAQGRLVAFYRRARAYVLLVVVLLAGVMLLGSESLLHWIGQTGWAERFAILSDTKIRSAVLGNVVLMALYLAQISFLYGLRTYVLVSVTEVCFSVVFTISALLWVAFSPGALSLLLAHMVSLGVVLVVTSLILRVGIPRIAEAQGSQAAPQPPEMEPAVDAEGDTVSGAIPVGALQNPPGSEDAPLAEYLRLMRYGLAGMLGVLVWQAAQYVSYGMVLQRYGEISAGGFWVMVQFAQPLVFLANAAWAVLFSHVARRWESGDRQGAMMVLETSYKAIALTIMTFSVLLYVTSPWWIHILHPRYQYGQDYLSGLLTFFLSVSNMTMLTIPANLHERPIVIALAALAGGVLIAILASLWMPAWGEVGAARAAGVGMFFGGGLVMLVYLLATNLRLHDSTYFVLGTPVILLLPIRFIGPLWAIVIPVCVFSPWIFDARQKRILIESLQKVVSPFLRMLSWRRSP